MKTIQTRQFEFIFDWTSDEMRLFATDSVSGENERKATNEKTIEMLDWMLDEGNNAAIHSGPSKKRKTAKDGTIIHQTCSWQSTKER